MNKLLRRQKLLDRCEQHLQTILDLCPKQDRDHYHSLDWWIWDQQLKVEVEVCDMVANDCTLGTIH